MGQAEIAPPKVFLSHASEDKDRFVRAFATQLREKGIEAWVDEWEIYPGDSLVQKIYDAGIGAAQAVLIVLSRNSVDKPWVKDELDVSVIRRIEEGMRIIPIVLDACTIPTALRATLHVKIPDLNNFDVQLSGIVDTLYGRSKKPALGSPPAYIRATRESVPGLKPIDSVLLKMAGDKEIENDGRGFISAEEMLDEATSQGISRYSFFESLGVLERKHYFKLITFLGGEPSEPELRSLVGGGVSSLSMTFHGFEQYAKVYIPHYKAIERDIRLQIVNHGQDNSVSIAEALQQPVRVIDHVLQRLAQRKYIEIIRESGPTTSFFNVSPELRRLVEEDS